ncbi:MAG: DUF1028 domain-containing protein [Candidatus Bipolaricaulota bacterium]|nr:DUF1028 domain-containing protein [Candidatus Bipolaricaulota bacterium]MDW8126791.1 DUF1028 domain-containing protein [Candidatus Bipolaricaulota bacterium]
MRWIRKSKDIREGRVYTSTFSIVACDPKTGELGVAVQSKFLAVGAVVPWAKAGVGAIATQSYANTSYGPKGLRLLAQGLPPQEVLDRLTAKDRERELRQIGLVNAQGQAAAFTGEKCLPWAGQIVGENFACQGNILVSERVVEAMAEEFTRAKGPLAERLLAALAAGQAAGGDRRGQQSAALLVVKERGGYGGFNDRYIDLRVDDHPQPIAELKRLYELHQLYFAPPSAQDLVPMTSDLRYRLQELLVKLGYFRGCVDGHPSPEFWKALFDFCGTENLEELLRKDEKFDLRILRHMERLAKERG